MRQLTDEQHGPARRCFQAKPMSHEEHVLGTAVQSHDEQNHARDLSAKGDQHNSEGGGSSRKADQHDEHHEADLLGAAH